MATPEEFSDQEIFYSDCKDNAPPMSNTTIANETHESYGLSVSNFDQSLCHNLTSDSAYEGDISTVATDTLRQKKPLRKRKYSLAPILRMCYYGRKRMMTGKRHFISSVVEYSMGSTLGPSSRMIWFYSLMVSPEKLTKKNKVPDPIKADVICDMGASVSLAPLSIAQNWKMSIDKSHLISVLGTDGKKLSAMGTSFIYMKAPASPSWRRVKV